MKKFLFVLMLAASVAMAADELPMQNVGSGNVLVLDALISKLRLTADSTTAGEDSSFGRFYSATYDFKDYTAGVLSINVFKIANSKGRDTTIGSDTLVATIQTACRRPGAQTICTLSVDTVTGTGEIVRFLGSNSAFVGKDSLYNDLWIDYSVWDSTDSPARHGTKVDYFIKQVIQPKR